MRRLRARRSLHARLDRWCSTVRWWAGPRAARARAATRRRKSSQSSIRICRALAVSLRHSETGRMCGMSQAEAPEGKRPEGEIIPPELAVRAMRDSGYRNTAYALAEIIDNSV